MYSTGLGDAKKEIPAYRLDLSGGKYLVLLSKAPPLPDGTLPDRVKANMLKLRADKRSLKGLVQQRSQLGGAFPSVNLADWWNKWEGHAALSGWVLPATPWDAVQYAGVAPEPAPLAMTAIAAHT